MALAEVDNILKALRYHLKELDGFPDVNVRKVSELFMELDDRLFRGEYPQDWAPPGPPGDEASWLIESGANPTDLNMPVPAEFATYEVTLTALGSNRLAVMARIREVAPATPIDAARTLPIVLNQACSYETQKTLRESFEGLGATVRICPLCPIE